MRDSAVISLSPSHDTMLSLLFLSKICKLFTIKFQTSRTGFPKTLIFCHTIAECSLMYQTLRNMLGIKFTDPPAYPDINKYRLMDVYAFHVFHITARSSRATDGIPFHPPLPVSCTYWTKQDGGPRWTTLLMSGQSTPMLKALSHPRSWMIFFFISSDEALVWGLAMATQLDLMDFKEWQLYLCMWI